MISVKTFLVGLLPTNTYVITDEATGVCAVVDPASTDSTLVDYLDNIGKDKIMYILLTHGHFDHIGYAYECAQKYEAKIVISDAEKDFLKDPGLNLSQMIAGMKLDPFEADILLSDGDKLTLGESEFSFMLTPGHTVGSGCFIFEENKTIFSGDTLFYLSMGRTDFATGDADMLLRSLKKICNLEGDYKVYPGHNRSTTLSYERYNNPYLY